ncbi:SDR family oxidoreductase [Pseudomonas sp. CG7]|uniref:SDR family oxidoreductase n=1 Tax=Pseudomonas sp. CG7 TaxID=191007 RepID=UPI002033205A|nr:SDR family oxidoreductase [Pseudomonas sp. CG7]MCM2459391.1 SDR family oxidoreductase [Pseudomonas sp. CG7]
MDDSAMLGPDRSVKDKNILVIAAGFDGADSLKSGLLKHSAQVCLVTDAQGVDASGTFFGADFSSRSSLASVLSHAAQQLGRVDAVVLALTPTAALVSRPITSMSVDDWREACLDPLRLTRHCLQESFRLFDGGTGCIIVLGPNFSLTGSAGLTALSTVSEGQRSLMKSAARQWGGQGIRLNWVGVDSLVLAPALHDAPIPPSPEMGPPPPALGFAPALAEGVAESIAILVGASALTGVSLPVDGGVWMVP